MESFLTSIETFLKLMPDFRPKNIQGKIRSKSKVLYYPVALIDDNIFLKEERVTENCEVLAERAEFPADQETLHIVWPHRWEHDKDPELFFNTMFQLSDLGVTFRLSVLGQVFKDVPEIFSVAKDRLARHIVHWGYQESQKEYLNVLKHADVAVSTAKHEFFGVAMLEAVCCKCFPLCPNRLVYPEIFPKECLYNTEQQLFKRLKQFITKPTLARRTEVKIDISKFAWSALHQQQRVKRFFNKTQCPHEENMVRTKFFMKSGNQCPSHQVFTQPFYR
ncbi:Hypothetical predicted protein, partial [Paramuricea clavata]